jgi:tetratricopeptide (TPR) repeat protein
MVMAKKDKKREEGKGKKFLFLSIRVWALAFFIAVLTFFVFLPAINNNFVNWDDDKYVYENFHIRSFNLDFFRWIFQFHESNWHPLTWLSHAIDYALWGLNPVGHHLSSILLHSANTLLVCILAIYLIANVNLSESSITKNKETLFTREIIAGAVTALLFGIHPLHVESVAWVAERKDVLCTFFALLSLIFYVNYIVRLNTDKKTFYYILSLIFFVPTLMSKPIAVTIPFVLVILDIYPFQRFSFSKGIALQKNIFIEKIPFFFFSLLSSILTIMAQHAGGAIKSLEVYPLYNRVLVALKGLSFYLEKMVFPFRLSPFYPYPKGVYLLSLNYIIPIIAVVMISLFCIWSWRKGKKIFSAVWVFYIITLLPVLGIVQIGRQAAADRYTYIPSIGPFLLAGLAIAILFEKIKDRGYPFVRNGIVVFLPVALVFFLFSVTTVSQIKVWKDSITLWTSVIERFTDCSEAYLNRANAYRTSGKYNEASRDLDSAIMLNPYYPEAYNNRGMIRKMAGDYKAAMEDFSRTIELNPGYGAAYSNRADLFMKLGEYQNGLKDLDKAIELEPDSAGFYSNRCGLYNLLGKYEQSIEDCTRAVEIDPRNAIAYNSRGLAFSALGNYSEAIADYNKSLTINPNPLFYFNRGVIYKNKGEYQMAVYDFSNAIKLNPKYIDAYINRGVIYGLLGKLEQAIEDFTRATLLNPRDASAYYNRGAAYYRLDKKKEAMKDFQKAARFGDKTIQKILTDRGISW